MGGCARLAPGWRAIAAAGAALVMLAASSGLAEAAGGPGWRLSRTVGARADFTQTSQLVATGSRDAFAEWAGCAHNCPKGNTFTLGRWDGSSWSNLPWPQSLHHFDQAINIANAMGASSASDLWILEATTGNSGVIRWNGHSWGVSKLPSWAIRINGSGNYDVVPVVAGPRDGWLFSLGYLAGKTPTYAAREIGGKWFKVNLGAVPVGGVVAYGANDIWLTVTKGDMQPAHPKYFFMHWNGSTWSAQPAPAVSVPHHGSAFITVVAASGTSDIWARVEAQDNGGMFSQRLLHWNGKSWTRVGLPSGIQPVGVFAKDGRGGLWVAAQSGVAPTPRYFLHYSGGRWTKVAIPVTKADRPVEEVSELVQVPGTTTMLAGGTLGTGPGNIGAIWQLGK